MASTKDLEVQKNELTIACQAHGCQINRISTSKLFQRYKEIGFLYQAKYNRLAPYLNEIEDNLYKVKLAGQKLFFVISYTGNGRVWSSLSSWRSTSKGWNTQHLVSQGSPIASRAVMLSTQAAGIADPFQKSQQCWFQSSKPVPNMVFGSIERILGTQYAQVATNEFWELPMTCSIARADLSSISVRECDQADAHQVVRLATLIKGEVYVSSEELAEDLHLRHVDQMYQTYGLRRYRRVWLAHLEDQEEPVGALLVYRGPLGLNFSFLENRADLLVHPELSDEQREDVVAALLKVCTVAYIDFSPGFIPIVSSTQCCQALTNLGGRFIRAYSQSIWLREAYSAWYKHVDNVYAQRLRWDMGKGKNEQHK